MKILIIEDKRDWQEQLTLMYEVVFKKHKPQITVVSNSNEALVAVGKDNNRWDLVSLDINLQGGRKPEENENDNSTYTAGQNILQVIAKKQTAQFVIVVTGIASDTEIPVTVRNSSGLLARTVTSLPVQLASLFPGKSMYFHKFGSAEDCMKLIAKQLLEDDVYMSVLEACRITNRLEKKSDGRWRIVYKGMEYDVDDSKGLYYLAEILGCPKEAIHVKTLANYLVRLGKSKPLKTCEEDQFANTLVELNDRLKEYSSLYDMYEVTGQQSQAYAEQLQAIEEDLKTKYKLSKEVIDRLLETKGELTQSERERIVGRVVDINKGARQRVGVNIKRLLAKLEGVCPELKRHLAPREKGGEGALRFLRKPASWVYDPIEDVKWEIIL